MLCAVMACGSCASGAAVADAAASEEEEGSGATATPRRWASQRAWSWDGPLDTPKVQSLSDVPACGYLAFKILERAFTCILLQSPPKPLKVSVAHA